MKLKKVLPGYLCKPRGHWEFLNLQNTLAGLRVTLFAFVALPFLIIQSIQESEVDNLFHFTYHIYPSSTVRAKREKRKLRAARGSGITATSKTENSQCAGDSGLIFFLAFL